MQFVVKDREIFYCDRVWSNWIRVIPKDDTLIKKIKLSRNKLPEQLIKMFSLSKKDIEEYNKAKTEEDLAELIINDARSKGCKFEKRLEDAGNT
jgi:hypothetical protein